MELMAAINPPGASKPNQTIADSVTVGPSTVGGAAATGLGTDEGVNQLTLTVPADGLYLLMGTLECVTVSGSASHFASWAVTYTGVGSTTDTAAQVAPGELDTDTVVVGPLVTDLGQAVVRGCFANLKSSGSKASAIMPITAFAGSTIKMQVSEALGAGTGAAARYRANAAIIRI